MTRFGTSPGGPFEDVVMSDVSSDEEDDENDPTLGGFIVADDDEEVEEEDGDEEEEDSFDDSYDSDDDDDGDYVPPEEDEVSSGDDISERELRRRVNALFQSNERYKHQLAELQNYYQGIFREMEQKIRRLERQLAQK